MIKDLQSYSAQLDDKLRELHAQTLVELQEINTRIEELNDLLQTKEMNTDRSENASFQIAKDERDIKVSIRSKLQKRVAALEAGSVAYVPTGIVTLGTTIDLSVITIDGMPPKVPISFIGKIVEHDIAKASSGLIAVDGKAGAALLGKRSGDTVLIRAIKGDILYKIERMY